MKKIFSTYQNQIFFLAVVFLFFFASCGPVYKTDYSFTAPTTQSGKTCVFQCENTKLQCVQLEEMRYERCLDRADREYDRCERNKRYKYKANGDVECVSNCYCYRSSCSINEDSCDERYRSCYQACGGKVKATTYCVSNCEKAATKD
ncbi:MAG: hypothetical protein KDD56_03080 [Bdellovibrionales bacterium]|nr:hypothetical protein [Bdellovibrionales bacterium]